MGFNNEEGFGSRFADDIINGSYYDGVEEEYTKETKGLTKAEENAIVRRLAQLMKGCGNKKRKN